MKSHIFRLWQAQRLHISSRTLLATVIYAIGSISALLVSTAFIHISDAHVLQFAQTHQGISAAAQAQSYDISYHHNCRVPAWNWPLKPITGTEPAIIHPFDNPAQPWLAGHRGLDLAQSTHSAVHDDGTSEASSGDISDTPLIYAPADGTIRFIGAVGGIPTISITHTNNANHAIVVSSYQPAEAIATLHVGDHIRQDQIIGTLVQAQPFTHCEHCLHWGVFIPGQHPTYLNPLLQVHRQTIVLKPIDS